jgi:peroxiredoxin
MVGSAPRVRVIGRAVRALAWAVVVAFVAALAACHSKAKPVEYANYNFTLKDMNGHDVKLADYKGKALLVNFWSTTCGPCQLETPELVDLAAKYKERGLAVLGISIDDTPSDIRKFANEYKVSYPMLVGADRDEVTQAFGLGDAIPMSVFITPKGTVLGRIEGLATQSWFERQIQSLLSDDTSVF